MWFARMMGKFGEFVDCKQNVGMSKHQVNEEAVARVKVYIIFLGEKRGSIISGGEVSGLWYKTGWYLEK